jgi:hypothetical protein
MRFRHLAFLLLLLPSCHHGNKYASMTSHDITRTYHSKLSNPYQTQRKSWIADKMTRLGLMGTKPSPPTQPIGTTTSEVFKSNQ